MSPDAMSTTLAGSGSVLCTGDRATSSRSAKTWDAFCWFRNSMSVVDPVATNYSLNWTQSPIESVGLGFETAFELTSDPLSQSWMMPVPLRPAKVVVAPQ